MRRLPLLALAITLLLVSRQRALAHDGGHDTNMSGQTSSMPGMAEGDVGHHQMSMEPHSFIALVLQHGTSGTDAEPNSTPFAMLMTTKGNWTLMFHGEGFLSEIQQRGPRGGDKLFSTNWWMLMAQRKFGKGTLTLRTMLSFEPATVSDRRYPELFQEGETAFGRPIVDGQHPHDFFMELAALYDYKISEHTLLSVYAAPMGDPAMGPMAYPHRASASEDPIAPLGHHFQDSTHIAADVVTLGITHRSVRLEASGFHGREPDEFRWNINSGKMDSWSARVTANPGQNWSLQYSIAQLHSPEELAPAEDIRRMTASVQYNRPLPRGNWASLLLWGRNQDVAGGNVGNSYLLESTVNFRARNYAYGRLELVDKDELFPSVAAHPSFRIGAYTVGGVRDLVHDSAGQIGLGADVTFYSKPAVLDQFYGANPVSFSIFLRFRPGSSHMH